MLNIMAQDFAINLAFNHHRGAYASQAERRNDRNLRTRLKSLYHFRTLSTWRACINAAHCQMGSKFINRPDSFGRPL